MFVNLWYVEAFSETRSGPAALLAIGRGVAWFDRVVVDGAINAIGACAGAAAMSCAV